MKDVKSIIAVLLDDKSKNILSISVSERSARNLLNRVAAELNKIGFVISQKSNEIEFNGKIIRFISPEREWKGVHSDIVFFD